MRRHAVDKCDVLVVGGGPAGSSCARHLVRAGARVVVLDKAAFPRDKVCAGWITPAVVAALELDLDEYAHGRTLQPFTAFRTGLFDGDLLLTDFERTISYGIRRCEFDDYLVRRSGARLMAGQALRELRRDADGWIANGAIHAAAVVGAAGHFCPVARHLNPGLPREAVVVAQEIEFRLDDRSAGACRVRAEQPELFFWPDLLGYGWCVRKGAYLNVGAGRLTQSDFPASARQFAAMLEQRGVVPGGIPSSWKGHAYLLNRTSSRRVYHDGMVLAGDAAGLALAPSGEGILAAVESGLMAAGALLAAAPDYSRERLAPYGHRIEDRFGPRGRTSPLAQLPGWLTSLASRAVFRSPLLTRRFLLEDAFLHVRRVPA